MAKKYSSMEASCHEDDGIQGQLGVGASRLRGEGSSAAVRLTCGASSGDRASSVSGCDECVIRNAPLRCCTGLSSRIRGSRHEEWELLHVTCLSFIIAKSSFRLHLSTSSHHRNRKTYFQRARTDENGLIINYGIRSCICESDLFGLTGIT